MSKARSKNPFDVSHLVCEDAERQVLASLVDLLDQDASRARTIGDRLSPLMFKSNHAGDVFAAMEAAWAAVQTPTRADVLTTLRQTARQAGVDPESDPARLLFIDLAEDKNRLGTGPQAARLAENGAREVVELHSRRRAILASKEVAEAAQRGDDLAAMTERLGAILAPTDRRDADGVITFDQCVDEYQNAQDDAVIPTGFRLFDDATDGGLPVGELTGLCAKPGAGKSALALQLAIGAMTHDPSLRVLWCLGEMTPRILVRRATCVGTAILGGGGVTMRDAKRRTVEAREAAESMRQLLGGGRFSVLKPALTIDRIASAIRAAMPKVVVIDYLQLMTGPGVDRIGEMEATVAQLTTLAITTETAIVVVSSMSKDAIKSGAGIGTIGKGSGQIDYAMSFVFLGEPDEEASKANATVYDVKWHCAKSRNEARQDFTARFDGAKQFYSRAIDTIEDFVNFGIVGGDR